MADELPQIESHLHRRLEADILARGCIIPVVVTKDNQVIDGQIRLAICEKHGLNCPRVFVDGDTEGLRLALNLFRRHLSREQVRELVRWELEKSPRASDRSIGRAVGCDGKTVASVRRPLAGAAEIPQPEPERPGAGGKAGRMPTVVYAPTKAMARQAQKVLQELDEPPPGVVSPRDLRVKLFRQRQAKKAASPVAKQPAGVELIHGDFRRLDWTAHEGRAALVLTDPPWLKQFARQRADLADLCRRLLRPGGVLAIYTGQYDLPDWLEKLGRALDYRWQMVALNEGSGTIRMDGEGGTIMTGFRPALYYSKGKVKNEKVIYDVLRAGKSKDWHPWEQPLGEALELVNTFTDPGDVIIDPCCGSGTTLAAVVLAGQGRRAVGCDIDEKAIESARAKLAEVVGGVGERSA